MRAGCLLSRARLSTFRTCARHRQCRASNPELVDLRQLCRPSHAPGAGSLWPTGSPGTCSSPSTGQTVAAIDESELLAPALDVAVRFGHPILVLIQHARGTRHEVTRTTGSMVFSDPPSYIVVMQGNLRAGMPSLPGHRIPTMKSSSPIRSRPS
jgi:hypothetical protein